MNKYMIIFLSKDHSVKQVITPSRDFNLDWKGLADSVSGDSHYGFLIRQKNEAYKTYNKKI